MPMMSAPASTCALAKRSSISVTNFMSSCTKPGSSVKSSIRVWMPRRLEAASVGPSIHPSTIFVAPARRFNSAMARTRSVMRPPPKASGNCERRKPLFIVEQGFALDDRRRLIVEEQDGRAEVGRFPGGI